MATPPKDIPEHDVLSVYARIARTLVVEGFSGFMGPGNPEDQIFFDVEGLSTRAELLYRMLKQVYEVKARILSAKRAPEHDAMYPDRAGLLDASSVDRAFRHLESARNLVTKAEAEFAHRWQVVQRGMQPFKVLPVSDHQARACAFIGEMLDQLLASNSSVENFPVISGAREWDELLTDFVVEILDRELFSDEDCAELIVGDRAQHKSMQLRRSRRQEQKSRIASGAPSDP